MNTVIPPHPPASTSLTSSEQPYSLAKIVAGLIIAVAALDGCFWEAKSLGFSLAVFVVVLAGAILLNRDPASWRRRTTVIVVLLAGACWAAAIETGVTNVFVLIFLIIALAGDTYYADVPVPWARWYSQAISLLFAPGRALWLGLRTLELAVGGGVGWAGKLVGGCLLVLPALVLALIFGLLLSSGNAVFGSWAGSFFNWAWNSIWKVLDPARILLWLFGAFLTLPLLRPARLAYGWWKWIPNLPRLPEMVPTQGALFSSALVLFVLNGVFLVANVADAEFLWSNAQMPAGVEYKAYVHEGFGTLIFTVLLTAGVLAAIFQQALPVAGSRWLKFLALTWVAQNLFLLASCALRLNRYVEESQLTVARLSCLIFLLLVVTGFALLTLKMVREHSLAWLVGSCLAAIFVQFYITQFLDLGGYAMNYNVTRFEREPSHRIDLWKLYEAGPAGWPAARRAQAVDPSITILNLDKDRGPVTGKDAALPQFDLQHWREFSLRAYWNRWALNDKK